MNLVIILGTGNLRRSLVSLPSNGGLMLIQVIIYHFGKHIG